MKVSLIFIFLTTIVATSHATLFPILIHLLRPQSGSYSHRIAGIDCLSWRLAVESNNIIGWRLVPEACENYVGHYMLGKQYRKDCNLVAATAYEYAKSVNLPGDGKDVWVFDIDETTLSNLPYYARSDVAFGTIPYNDTQFHEWVSTGSAPAIPASLKLYKKLLSLGLKIVFLTSTYETYRDIRISNLKAAGYHTWEKLVLKKDSQRSISAVEYKSGERKTLEEAGYRIVGNMGDQWSDLIGTYVGNRTFKVPDPMYYIS